MSVSNKRDIYLKFDLHNRSINTLETGELYRSGELSSGLLVSTYERSIKDDSFHGVKITLCGGNLVVKNDFFCTIPLYHYCDETFFYISSDPDLIINEHLLEFDHVGVWESILLGGCIYDRSLFLGLKQLPALHLITVDGVSVTVRRDDDLVFKANNDESPEEIIAKIDNRLEEIFKSLNDKNYSMGVSGGLDSRLSLLYLKNSQHKYSIQPFTYCATMNSLEFKLAKSLCDSLDVEQPVPYKIKTSCYFDCAEQLINKSGGQIGRHHSHILSFYSQLPESKRSNLTQISNYYTDAIFGWATERTVSSKEDSWTQFIKQNDIITSDIKVQILDDIQKVMMRFTKGQNFSCADEFKYVFERNQKFHLNLAFQQNRYCQTILPFCDYKLLKLAFSLPFKYRAGKKLSDLIIAKKHSLELGNISSRQMRADGSFSAQNGISKVLKNLQFKFSNILTYLCSLISAGYIVYPNKFQTEAHYNLYHKMKSRGCFKKSVNILIQHNLINKEQSRKLLAGSVFKGSSSNFFQLSSVAEYIDNKIVKHKVI